MTEPEATYQREAERDGERRDVETLRQWCASLSDPLWPGLTESDWAQKAGSLLDALAVAERERDQAREALRLIADRKVPRSARSIADAYRQVSDFAEAALAEEGPAMDYALALRSALAVAERERDEWKATAEAWEDSTGTQLLIAERDRAERERDQARQALQKIVNFPFDVMSDDAADIIDMKAIADAALGEPS